MANKCRELVKRLKKRKCQLCFQTKISSRFLFVGKEMEYESVPCMLWKGIGYELFKEKLKNFKGCCKSCYKEHKDPNKKCVKYTSKSRCDLLDWFHKIKSKYQCLDCGNDKECVLDFHHLHKKTATISKLLRNGATKPEIVEEMNKCIILCCNCHVKRHFGTGKIPLTRQNEITRIIRGLKNANSCGICGENAAYCLQFHHRDKTAKLFSLSEARKLGKNKEEVRREIRKCDLICGNCHRSIHA